MKFLKKHNLLVAAIYLLLWIICLFLPNYRMFEFIGVEYESEMEDVLYLGYENLFDQVYLFIIGLATILSGFGKITAQKRVFVILFPIIIAFFYMLTFAFRSSFTGFSQRFQFGYDLTVILTFALWLFYVFCQLYFNVEERDRIESKFYAPALTFTILSLVVSLLNQPYRHPWPTIIALGIPLSLWIIDRKKKNVGKKYVFVMIIWLISFSISIYEYLDLWMLYLRTN